MLNLNNKLNNKLNVYLERKARLTISVALYTKKIVVLTENKPSLKIQLNSGILMIFRHCVT